MYVRIHLYEYIFFLQFTILIFLYIPKYFTQNRYFDFWKAFFNAVNSFYGGPFQPRKILIISLTN